MQERTLARVIKEGVVQRLCRQHRGQRQEAAGQALGQAHQVRHHPGLFAGEQRAGAAHAGLDLVQHQQCVGLVAQFAHALQISPGCWSNSVASPSAACRARSARLWPGAAR
ncbi:hypothetical protein G6F54_013984 [Rhizopus delemar]|nr:hypothetical protein G6F54_013984 [Rhizopus delemar]